MLTPRELGAIDEYLTLNIPIAEIARRVGVSKPTIYKRIKEASLTINKKKSGKKIDREITKYEHLIKRGLKHRLSMRVIHTILEEQGCTFSYATTCRYVKELQHRKKKQYKASRKRYTGPGEEAQVDWGHYGKVLVDGKARTISFFSYVLGYSRCRYVEFTVNQTRKTLKQCHLNAFRKLGVPQRIMYDNMTTVRNERIKIKRGQKYTPVPEFQDFAKTLGFEIILCAPHHPRSKGKVENSVGFIKKNFLARLRFHYKKEQITLELLNLEVQKWIEETHERVHDETHEKPNVLWKEEKQYVYQPDLAKLAPLLTPVYSRKISKDGYLFINNLPPFQLPEEYKEEWVEIRELNEHGVLYIEVYFENKKLAKYLLANEKDHENLLAKEAEARQTVTNGNNDKSTIGNYKKQPLNSGGGFYRPDGYYDKFTGYHNNLWERK